MDCIANLPTIAAVIYNNLYREGVAPKPTDMSLDWSANYCNMINYTDPKFVELMRLYMTIHRLVYITYVSTYALIFVLVITKVAMSRPIPPTWLAPPFPTHTFHSPLL